MAGEITLAQLGSKLDRFQRELSREAFKQRMHDIGQAAKEDGVKVVSSERSRNGSLADLQMSGWTRKKPIDLTPRYIVKQSAEVLIIPGRAAGPWRVLESGRQPGVAGSKRLNSKTRMLKSGELKTYTSERVRKRTVGATDPKKTWTRFRQLELDRLPPRVRQHVEDAMARCFSR